MGNKQAIAGTKVYLHSLYNLLVLCAQGSDLLSAVKGGRVKEIEDLLKKGVNINCSDNVRRVCMYVYMYACMYVRSI
jgi:hypothetical protein